MAVNCFLDRLAYLFHAFRWILVFIEVVVIALSISLATTDPSELDKWSVITVFTSTSLGFNAAVGIADAKARKRIPGETEFPTPKRTLIVGDSIFAILHLALWFWSMIRPSWVPFDPYYDAHFLFLNNSLNLRSAYSLVGVMVVWNFHLTFAVVSIIRGRRIEKIVEARQLGSTRVEVNN